jgi:hypothetical protein
MFPLATKPIPEPATVLGRCGRGTMTAAVVLRKATLLRAFPKADDGVRTRDPQLGKLMLYQLSYVRADAEDSAASAA